MVEQPTSVFPSPAGGYPASRAPAGLNQSNVEIRSKLLEPTNQAATSQSCTDNGEINFSHVR